MAIMRCTAANWIALLLRGSFLLFCPALSQLHSSAEPPFNFSARSGGWQVNAGQAEVSLTWLASGVTWRSPLIGLTPKDRTAYENNGCWKHVVKDLSFFGQLASSATLNSGSASEDGHVILKGVIMSQPLHGKRVLVPSNWTMQLVPEKSGGMSFKINVELKDDSETLQSGRPGGAQETYVFPSIDVSLNWFLADREQLVGAGEQFSMVGLRGENFNVWTGEQGIGRGREPISRCMGLVAWPCGGDSHTTYSAVPALLSTRGYGIALDNPQLVNVDLTSPTATMTVAFENAVAEVSGHIWAGTNTRSLLPGLTDITGRMAAPPSWTQEGLIIGAEGGYKVVQNYIDKLLAAKVPLAGIWIQDWTGKIKSKNGEFVWWNWVLDEQRYPKSWLRNLNAQGIKVLTYINPFLTNAPNDEGRPAEVFAEAARLGHFVKDKTGSPIIKKSDFADFKFGMVDVFKPEAKDWWINVLKCNVMMACEDGKPLVHAWMHDYGEYFPLDAVPHPDGPQGHATDLHNQFPLYSAVTARKASEGFPNVTFFARSGGLRSPGMANIFWAGDQLTTYDACDGLQSALIGIMSGGLSGWTVNHADIGGFTMINRAPWLPLAIHFKRDAELNVRWLELTVFINAIYRSHPGLIPASSSQLWDDDMLLYTKRMTELFRDLAPYRQSLFSEAANKGLPLVRHGILVEPGDPAWFDASQSFSSDNCTHGNQIGLFQFYFGDDVIVVPALRHSVDQVYAYIPHGAWTNFWSNETVQGPSYKAWNAPLGQPVFFYRVSSSWAGFFRKLSEHYAPQPSVIETTFV